MGDGEMYDYIASNENCIRCNVRFTPYCQHFSICKECERTMKREKNCSHCGEKFIPFNNMNSSVKTSGIRHVTSNCFVCLNS